MGKSKIAWTEMVWNPITGCDPASPGCANCYASAMAARFNATAEDGKRPFAVRLHPDRLHQPLRWTMARRVFVCSMGDLFHDDVPDAFRDRVFGVMAAAHWHTFYVLTKRPSNALVYLRRLDGSDGSTMGPRPLLVPEPVRPLRRMPEKQAVFHRWPLANVWIGVSAESQVWADRRIGMLLDMPARHRFVSLEPLLGPVDLTGIMDPWRGGPRRRNALEGPNRLEWVIAGGESGADARPMRAEWARELRDQCKAAGVPFYFKQWGEWLPAGQVGAAGGAPAPAARRCGAKGSGSLLDGQCYHEKHGGIDG